jgi:hypothetical protein
MGMFNTEESILGTPPTKPRVQTPPGTPVKPNNPVVRNIFADSFTPTLTEQQIIDYLGTPRNIFADSFTPTLTEKQIIDYLDTFYAELYPK